MLKLSNFKQNHHELTPLSVGFILLPEFTLSAFAGFVDTLRLAADDNFNSQQKYCKWTIMNVNNNVSKSSCGVNVLSREPLRLPIDFDCIVVVGGLVKGHQKIDPLVLDYLKKANEQDLIIVGLCTGSFALAYAGLMNEKTTCVHWFHKPDFQMAFPSLKCITDTVFYEDGKLITCAGGGVSSDVATYVLDKFCGRDRARIGASGMLMGSPKGIRSPQGHIEADWFNDIKAANLRRSILIMDQNVRKAMTTDKLAKKAGLSKYQFSRLFKKDLGISASLFYRVMRLANGHRDVLRTRRNITDIAIEFGFADASHFIKLYREYLGMSPSEARNIGIENFWPMVNNRFSTNHPLIKDLFSGKLFFSSVPIETGATARFDLPSD